MLRLADKVAIITGGNSGIGRATALRFAEEGAFVYIVARREAELAEVVAEIGDRAAGIRADITSMDDLDKVYARIAADGRRLDVVVVNAGRVERVILPEADADHFDRIFDLNVRGAFFKMNKFTAIEEIGQNKWMIAFNMPYQFGLLGIQLKNRKCIMHMTL